MDPSLPTMRPVFYDNEGAIEECDPEFLYGTINLDRTKSLKFFQADVKSVGPFFVASHNSEAMKNGPIFSELIGSHLPTHEGRSSIFLP